MRFRTHAPECTAGGCTEDCKYCSQSSSYKTPTKASRLIDIEPVLKAARQAKENGSTRFCMGAAWRDLAGKKSGFEKILKMVTEVRGMGMEGESSLLIAHGNEVEEGGAVVRGD
jgi:biotin synthase-like enzyme